MFLSHDNNNSTSVCRNVVFFSRKHSSESSTALLKEYLQEYQKMGLKDAANKHTDESAHLLNSSSEPINITGWTSCLGNSQFLTECSTMFIDSKNIVTDADVKDIFTGVGKPIVPMETDEASSSKICPIDNKRRSSSTTANDFYKKAKYQISSMPTMAKETVTVVMSPPVDVPIESKTNDPDRKFSFRTGRDELYAQNAKKHCNNSNGNSSTSPSQQQQPFFMYGAGRKSLGGRRKVQNNFVLPIAQPKPTQ